MGLVVCEGCGEKRDVDGQMYDFGPTLACGQCWMTLLRAIRYGGARQEPEEPGFWRRQCTEAINRAVAAEKERDELQSRFDTLLADRNACLSKIRKLEEEPARMQTDIDRLRAIIREKEQAEEGAPTGFDRCHGRTGRK